jgi:hypothetical protein
VIHTTPTADIFAALATLADCAADDDRARAYLEHLFAEARVMADELAPLDDAYIAGYVARGIVQALAGAA